MKYGTYKQPTVYPEDIECVVEAKNGKGAIYVGNLEASENLNTLKQHGIKAVLTASKNIFLNHPKQEVPHYLYVPGQDHERFDLSIYFDKSADFIAKVLEETNVLVHCMAGISRSVSLVLAYLMKHRNMGFRESLESVRRKRRIINPNRGFIRQLEEYERQSRKSVEQMRRSTGNLESAHPKTISQNYSRYDPYDPNRRSYISSSFYKKPQSAYLRQSVVGNRTQAESSPLKNLVDTTQGSKFFNTKYKIEQSRVPPTKTLSSYTDLNKELDKKIENIRKKYMQTTELLESNSRKGVLSPNVKHQSIQNHSRPYLLNQSRKNINYSKYYNHRRGGCGLESKDSQYPFTNISHLRNPLGANKYSTIEPYSRKYLQSSITNNFSRPNMKKMVSFDCEYDY